jgi:hypothetical protein
MVAANFSASKRNSSESIFHLKNDPLAKLSGPLCLAWHRPSESQFRYSCALLISARACDLRSSPEQRQVATRRIASNLDDTVRGGIGDDKTRLEPDGHE